MKVLFTTYPMAFHTPGGGEVQLLAYNKHLPAYGVEVTLFDPWNPRFLEHDVVHFFSCVGGSIHFCQFVKQLGLPLVISSSLWITENRRHLYPVNEIRGQFQLADKIVTNSNTECEVLSRVLNLHFNKFATVYNGIDEVFLDKPCPAIFRNHFSIHEPFILNVGNIEPRKNQFRLAQAMKYFPDYKLVLIGNVRDEDYLQKVKKTALGQLIFIGALPNESEFLRSAYQACQTFVLPSTLETPGLAALEAAAQGATLVVTQEGSTKEYFADNSNTFFVDPESVDSIKDGIRKSLNYVKRNATINSMQNYLWHNVIKDLADIYHSVNLKKK
jgi:glycosyltransferase involved in cell wall biosynthesis